LQRSIPPVLSLSPTMCSIPAAKMTSQQTTAITLTDQSPIATSSDATLMEQAIALMQSGNLEAACQTAQTILQQNQTYAPAYSLLGVIALQQKQWQTAQQLLEQAIALDRHSAEDHSHLGMVYFQLGQFELGIAAYQQAIASQPDSLLIRYNLAMAYRKIGRLSDASDQLQQILQQNRHHLAAQYQLGNLCQQQQQFTEAIAHYRSVLDYASQPNITQLESNQQIPLRLEVVYYNLGVALQEQGDRHAAQQAYQQAIALRPNYSEAYHTLGTLLAAAQPEQAIACYQRALQSLPEYVLAWINLGKLQSKLKHWSEAETSFRRALQLTPNTLQAIDGLLHVLLQTCQWQEIELLTHQLWQLGQEAITTDVSIYNMLFLSFTSAQQLQLARNHAEAIARKTNPLRQILNFTFTQRKPKPKIRLGYVSGDYREQAVAGLIERLFELHDRQKFEVFAYALGPDDGSHYRQKFVADSDCFRDVYGWNAAAIAQQIYEDEVDILIDLEGYTEYANLSIYALRPAPLIVSYIGHLGTSGASFIDYLIGDEITIPFEQTQYYSEHCLHLPVPYYVTSPLAIEALTAKPFSRADCGLPEDAFVFCVFNKVPKLEPTLFAVWMRILQQVPNSVLWLSVTDTKARENLITFATEFGIERDRLIFTQPTAKQTYLRQLQCADLFLDTRYHNAAVTAVDVLQVGLPLLTCTGHTFASRIATSLLTAANLPELITTNLQDYEQRAIHLATHATELAALRRRLSDRTPLFDPSQTIQYLETAYQRIWQLHQTNQPPQPQQIGFLNPGLNLSVANSPSDKQLTTHSQPTELLEDRMRDTSPLTCTADLPFQTWLQQSGGSLIINTYQANKLIFLGSTDERLTLLARQMDQPKGIAIQGDRLAVATTNEIILFANSPDLAKTYGSQHLPPQDSLAGQAEQTGQYDALYLPRTTYHTGDLNTHDLSFGTDGLWIVNTMFSCLASLSHEFNFVPRWKPDFVSAIAPEDRCHLNGMAMVNGQPKYVTARAVCDQSRAWLSEQLHSGILMDVETGEIMVDQLCLPHSPRWYDNQLWVLNSGKGQLCRVDLAHKTVDVVCTLPGFLRGLCFVGEYAIVGLCQIRQDDFFHPALIQNQCPQIFCGVALVHLPTRQQAGLFKFTGGCTEISDVQFLPNIRRANLLMSSSATSKLAFALPQRNYWICADN
jgi:uncharacterized protein (TIGR03032 family)